MGLSHRSGAELVVCKCVMEFSEDSKAGNEDPLEKLGEGTVKVDASERRGTGAILFPPLENGLHKALLPRFGLSVMVPDSVEHQEEYLPEAGARGSEHAISDAIRTRDFIGGRGFDFRLKLLRGEGVDEEGVSGGSGHGDALDELWHLAHSPRGSAFIKGRFGVMEEMMTQGAAIVVPGERVRGHRAFFPETVILGGITVYFLGEIGFGVISFVAAEELPHIPGRLRLLTVV